MPSSNENAVNRAGLTPTESKALPTREPTAEEKKIIDHISELYKCKPTNSSYDVYTSKAVFHDPIGFADGLDLIKAQFNGLPKIFDKATIDRLVVLQTPSALPNSTILVDQDVTYYRKADTPTKTVNSLLTLERDAQGKITRHTEEWDHKRETDRTDGFFGYLNESRKSLTAKVTLSPRSSLIMLLINSMLL
ncbi:hypothetical protein RQP46_002031 [Phenoliferia psychrophenolica]